MTDELKSFISERKEAEKRFNALSGEEKERAEKQRKNLEARMQAEENVTVVTDK